MNWDFDKEWSFLRFGMILAVVMLAVGIVMWAGVGGQS